MKKVLLTGAAGFIGSRTSQLLLDAQVEVVGVDNLDPYYDVQLKRRRLEELVAQKSFKFLEGDIEDKEFVNSIPLDDDVDTIINLAARAGVRNSIRFPNEYFSTNVLGALNLLELAKTRGVSRFVLASTSSVYAGHSGPFVESLSADNPLSPYAASKRSAELLAHSYHYLHGIHVAALRYFTVYGPSGRPDMAILRFIKRIYEGETIEVFGDGNHSRDFTFVDDIARGTIAATGIQGYEVVNLGNGSTPVSLNQVVAIIERLIGREARVQTSPPMESDMLSTFACIEKARKLMNWEPTVGIEEGVARTLEWYRKERSWAKDLQI